MKFLCRLFLCAIISLCSTSLLNAAPDHTGNIPRLIQATPALVFESYGESGGSGKTLLEVNPQVLNDLSKNRLNRIVIPAIDREVIFDKTFQKIRSKTSTWIGRGDEGKSRVVLTIGSDHFFGRVVTADSIIVFEPGQLPSQVISTALDPSYEVPFVQDEIIAPQSVQEFFATPEPSDDGTRIDVMVLYTAGMADAYPGSQIDTRIQQLIDLANLSFTNSNINTQYHLVYSQEVDYPDNTGGNQGSVDDMGIALDDLTDNNGVFGNIETLRTAYGADQVTLLRRFVDEGCGLAWFLRWGDDADLAYALVHDGFKTDGSGYYCSNLTYAHEIGHKLGCAHDPAHSSNPG
ncbi:MAG: hypothetical protein JRF72_10755, partial [Deltaproteobacteria bacterium]|nr:hypothetical protein [Deltaproteobacteria bacterium]